MGLFEESYQRLNAAQKEAVDYLEGPVLVVAGPGTGKTQLLSMRVANILRQTDTDPESILCLTFTNKAAINMRERLIALTGGEARNVMVKTFHSFAAELMNMYPDYFWNGARLTTAPDATQIEIIQDVLSNLPLNNPLALKFAGNFTAGNDVKNALKLAKEAGLTPEKLEALVQANLAYLDVVEPHLIDILASSLSFKKLPELKAKVDALPEQGIDVSMQPLQDLGFVLKDSLAYAISQDEPLGKTTNTSKWKQRFVQSVDGQKGMHKERERNEWWLALADVYRSYRGALHQRGYYDYSDMIIEVIAQLQQHAGFRADAQERFLYVLIDEFQDTNAAQLQLAHLIADHHLNEGSPNLMAVGDDDQSIYKFNGAELNNMLSFRTSYPSTKLIVLQENYRSSQAILDASTKIIEQASDRLVNREPDITKHLLAKNEPKTPGQIVGSLYPTQEHELSGVAHDIASAHKTGNHSIAVLARGHASLRRLSSLLLALDVPVSYEQQSNILEHPAVVQVHTLNSLLIAVKQGNTTLASTLLAETLRHPMWKLDPKLLWSLATANHRSSNWLDYMLRSSDENLSIIAQWLLWLANESAWQPLPVIIEYVVGLRAGEHMTSPLREYFLGQKTVDTDYMHALSAFRLLSGMVNEFSRTSTANLEDFVTFVQLAIDTNEIIADESVFVSGKDAVELLTVHKAKGLEFDTVYIIDATDNNWKPSAGGRKSPANLPLQPNGDDADDYARLMYVAATRAKRSLYAASYLEDVNGKDVMPTPLLTTATPYELISPDELDDPITILEQHLSWPHLNIADEKANLRSRLESYSLSATGVLDFLDVTRGGPEQFFEKHLLSLPQATTANMAFGNAVHAALELAQIQTNAGGTNLAKILKHYQETLEAQYLPKNDHERYLDHGKELLKKLLNSETFWLPKGGLPEQDINDVRLGDAIVKGKIDRIDVKKDGITIVDYKTGKPLSSFNTRDQTKAVKAWRHRTQLIFYALLLQNSARFKTDAPITGQMQYVEATTAKELVREFIPSQEEIDRLAHLIQIIWPKIKELNLPNTTNYSADYTGIQAFEQDLLDGRL